MKTNNCCAQYAEELAVNAADGSALSPAASRHVSECGACQKKLVELEQVAAIHSANAATLPLPRLPLQSHKIRRALQKHPEATGTFRPGARPILACSVAIIAILLVFFVRRHPPETVESKLIVRHQLPDVRTHPENFEPTLLALRHELREGGDNVFAALPNGAPALRHYRVKDVESELRN